MSVCVDGHYKREVNKRNPLGTKGRFAGVIEETFRLLWKGERTSFSPTSLRMIMSRMNDQFNGYGQQDAHEAMAFVIDSLHEVGINRETRHVAVFSRFRWISCLIALIDVS